GQRHELVELQPRELELFASAESLGPRETAQVVLGRLGRKPPPAKELPDFLHWPPPNHRRGRAVVHDRGVAPADRFPVVAQGAPQSVRLAGGERGAQELVNLLLAEQL